MVVLLFAVGTTIWFSIRSHRVQGVDMSLVTPLGGGFEVVQQYDVVAHGGGRAMLETYFVVSGRPEVDTATRLDLLAKVLETKGWRFADSPGGWWTKEAAPVRGGQGGQLLIGRAVDYVESQDVTTAPHRERIRALVRKSSEEELLIVAIP